MRNRWSTKRLTTKVYWTTAVGFLGFVTIFMVLQLIFFQPYSLRVRASQLENDFRTMYKEIQDEPVSKQGMEKVANFDTNHYSLSGIVYKQGTQVNVYLGTRPLSITLAENADEGAQELSIQLIMADPGTESIPATPVEPAQPAVPSGDGVPQQFIRVSWYNADAQRLNNLLQEKLSDMLQAPLDEGVTTELFEQDTTLKMSEERVWAAIAPLSPDQGQDRFLVTVSTLAPVSDAVALLGGFYRYFYIAAVILLLGFAFLFSRMISNPLVKLNHMAKRLAKLDFSVRTDMKRQDEIGELAETFDYLATELRDTMSELQGANEQLQQDIEKEKQLEHLRKRFVASVSHELKTPVSLIQGYAEALRDNVGQGLKRDKYAAVIIHEAERMTRLVNDLLDLSQLESGKFRLTWNAVPLRELIQFVLVTIEPIAVGRSLQLHWNLEQQEMKVRSDAQRLQQILTNVLTNAIRHADGKGKIEVTVDMVTEQYDELLYSSEGSERTPSVRLCIFNPGKPIAEEHLPHLWDAFYRTDESGSRSSGGNGIGLSIVKHLLDKHGSAYAIRNVQGGVEVIFTLPIMNE